MGLSLLMHAPDAKRDAETGDYPDGAAAYLDAHVSYARFDRMRSALHNVVGATETPLGDGRSWVEWDGALLPEAVRDGVVALLLCGDHDAHFNAAQTAAIVVMLEWAIPQLPADVDKGAREGFAAYLAGARAAAAHGWCLEHY